MARPAETWLRDNGPGPAFVELVHLRPNDSRLLVPAPAERFISWLKPREEHRVVLELAEPGRVIGEREDNFNRRASETISESIDKFASDRLHRSVLLAIGERFMFAKIFTGRYLNLTERVYDHLDIERANPATLYFVALADTFELWNKDFRAKLHDKIKSVISDLENDLL